MSIITILEKISSAVWGNGLIFLLLGTGFFFTIRLKAPQLKLIPQLIKLSRVSSDTNNTKGISQLKTVCMSLGTAMGTGNITGVASALAIGGPGAIFWMWVSAFLGMTIVYCENFLAVKYKRNSCIGPMAYLKYGLKCPWLAVVFAFFCVCAALGMGGIIQISSFTDTLYQSVSLSPVVCAVIIFLLIFAVISGGTDRIGSAANILLPIVTVAYTTACFCILFLFRERILPAFGEIFSGAFGFRTAVGGISGFAVSRAVSAGIRRGVFSNEAGLGSSPILHCASENSSPELQGLWSMFEVFFDTIVCCTLTALTLIVSSENGCFSVVSAFSTLLGDFSGAFLTLSMGVFAFCTIIGWYYCGERAFSFLSKGKGIRCFCIAFAAFSSLGAVLKPDIVWTLSDIFNGLMAFANLPGLLLLANKVRKV